MIDFHFAVPYDGGHKDQKNWREHYLGGSDVRASDVRTSQSITVGKGVSGHSNENIVVKI